VVFGVAGTELAVVKLMNGHDPTRFTGAIACWYRVEADAQDPAIPVFECGSSRDGNSWRGRHVALAPVPPGTSRHRAYHAWGTLCEGTIAARLAGIPLVVHGEHGTLDTRPRNLSVQRWVWRHTDQVLSVSSHLSDRMAQVVGFPRERIVTIPTVWTCSASRRAPPTRQGAHSELNPGSS
jgi:hypothetical protein